MCMYVVSVKLIWFGGHIAEKVIPCGSDLNLVALEIKKNENNRFVALHYGNFTPRPYRLDA